ncbi:hypothetical protein ACFY5J_20810 [Peribacillus butanolivorans]|uniref:hypothetical protein n=1 Tax=Peribacillus butanolivorans TaxID=421767 RepID=UPI003686B006
MGIEPVAVFLGLLQNSLLEGRCKHEKVIDYCSSSIASIVGLFGASQVGYQDTADPGGGVRQTR